MIPIETGGKNENGRVASPERKLVYLRIILIGIESNLS